MRHLATQSTGGGGLSAVLKRPTPQGGWGGSLGGSAGGCRGGGSAAEGGWFPSWGGLRHANKRGRRWRHAPQPTISQNPGPQMVRCGTRGGGGGAGAGSHTRTGPGRPPVTQSEGIISKESEIPHCGKLQPPQTHRGKIEGNSACFCSRVVWTCALHKKGVEVSGAGGGS